MDHFELLQRLAVALGVGLLIGLERGWVGRDEPEGERALGLRTLGLSGLLGGVIGAIALLLPQAGAPLLAAGFAAFALIVGVLRAREMVADQTFGATSVVAALLVFALGAFAVMIDKGIAAACGVAAAALLALKPVLHAWLRRMTWPELRSALVLLAMSVILLPVLPDRGYGPWQAVNPYEIWLMTILIALVSSIGYVAIRIAGERWGILLSAVAGALVSSTAVTLALARLGVAQTQRVALIEAGILAANATMLIRVLVVAVLLNAALLRWLLIPVALAALVLLVWSGLRQSGSGQPEAGQRLELTSPFDLATVLKFAGLLVGVVLVAKAASTLTGASGVLLVAAAAGIADVDAITLSMARLGGRELALATAAAAILVAAAVNTLTKLVLVRSAGGQQLARALLLPLIAATLAGGFGLVVTLWVDPLAQVAGWAGWR